MRESRLSAQDMSLVFEGELEDEKLLKSATSLTVKGLQSQTIDSGT